MDEHNVDTLLGKMIANNSLLISLIRVLPLEALRALEPEVQRDMQFGADFFVGQDCSDQTIESFEWQAQANLDAVRNAREDKEALQTPGAAVQWLRARLDPNDD